MDCFCRNKKGSVCENGVVGVKEKVKFLKEEIRVMRHEREKESRGYERDLMVYAFKEAEWKQEKKRLKEEVKRLRTMVEEKEEKIRGMADFGVVMVGEKDEDLQIMGKNISSAAVIASSLLVEQMEEERALRDEAVEKWKQLYLAIKTELDDLIQRTHRDGLCWRAEEEYMIEELKMEVKAKEEIIEEMKARLTVMENEDYKKDREIDILRQSLKIISSRKGSRSPISKGKVALVIQAGQS